MLTEQQQHRISKAASIADRVIQCAEALNELMPIAYPRKRPRIHVRAYRRTPAREMHTRARKQKMAIRAARANALINPMMTAAQIHLILSQPIPKYPKGGLINDNGEEIYITNDKSGIEGQKYNSITVLPTSHSIQPIPPGQFNDFRKLVLSKLADARRAGTDLPADPMDGPLLQ